MAHNIPSWLLASGLVALGMDWKQAVFTIALANLIVLVPMLLTGHAGPKYGIPFPVLARASFGLRGANLPALIRAAVACAWFGIQTWIGGQGIFVLLGKIFGGWAERRGGRRAAVDAVAVLRALLGARTRHHLPGDGDAAPVRELGGAVRHRRRAWCCWSWIAVKAGGLGPLLDQPSKLGWGADFWKVFFPSLMGMIAFWSTLSLNIPDFTRFGAGQRAQVWGQIARPADHDDALRAALGLRHLRLAGGVRRGDLGPGRSSPPRPTTSSGCSSRLVTVLVATISVNIAANVVSARVRPGEPGAEADQLPHGRADHRRRRRR